MSRVCPPSMQMFSPVMKPAFSDARNNKEAENMEKFIPYEKLSKKEKRKMDLAKRQTWGELNPVTRKPENSKAYNRNRARNWKIVDDRETNSGIFICIGVVSAL